MRWLSSVGGAYRNLGETSAAAQNPRAPVIILTHGRIDVGGRRERRQWTISRRHTGDTQIGPDRTTEVETVATIAHNPSADNVLGLWILWGLSFDREQMAGIERCVSRGTRVAGVAKWRPRLSRSPALRTVERAG